MNNVIYPLNTIGVLKMRLDLGSIFQDSCDIFSVVNPDVDIPPRLVLLFKCQN